MLKKVTDLSADEHQTIQKHRCLGGLDKDSLLTEKLRFFGIYAKSEKQYKKAVDEAIETVQNIIHKF